MCGIAGILLAGGTDLPDMTERVRAMEAAMLHRGPDDGGVVVLPGERGALANRRLAIRDLSPAGHMPMTDGSLTITFNGEIYNADELRAELEAAGHHFHSAGDTEVILKGYREWGEGIAPRLRGIFAFAIADTSGPEPSLLLARDHLGVKPLYHAQVQGAFIFASELRALRASGLVSNEISPAGLVGYLILGSVPIPHTILRDVHALEPATTLAIHPGVGTVTVRQRSYWSFPSLGDESIRVEDAAQRVRSLLEDAVASQLVSDVPLGAFLSGGMDSSAVVALMRQATSGTIRTCSMAFAESAYDESSYARTVADAFGTEHVERIVSVSDVASEMDNVFASMDQPSIDGVNTYFVSQTARQAGLTVALSGLGGDELFGGYPNTFRGVPQMRGAFSRLNAVPFGRHIARQALRTGIVSNRLARMDYGLSGAAPEIGAYLTRRGLFSAREVQRLVTPEIWHAARHQFQPQQYLADRVTETGGRYTDDPYAWISRAELTTYTLNQLLRDTDVMSMAHSLEVRVPLLDHRLVEAVVRMPQRVKTQGSRIKPLFAAALSDLLPPPVRNRTEKSGFVFPFADWMRGSLRLRLEGALDAGLQVHLLDSGEVNGAWRRFQDGSLHWSRAWALAVLCHDIGGTTRTSPVSPAVSSPG
jgi:asparagine synthase (glutamine-hydrolysing)